ncbi:MAG: 16S rRNA (cytosine(1402)-N(4))-methyltransferase RsmH [Alphaproteobacteria bacterium]|nr:16S rRNA (cytosine(1402)-N(4))-methyltransferase RsmH [Alphaproteobacteria bacterium]
MIKHIPVLVDAVMNTIGNIKDARVLDATFGAGGYTRRFLESGANVTAFDRDPNVVADADIIKKEFDNKFDFIPKTFSHMADLTEKFDAIVFDLGISSMQIDNPERGFSFRADAPLDMRMSFDGPTVCDMFDKWTIADITKILRDFGDIKPAGAIANAIKQFKPRTTFELKDLIHNPRDIAPVFQALRIAVNDEMGELVRALDAVPNLLQMGGRCICVTFHSVEDRIVKNTFRKWTSIEGDPRILVNTSAPFKLLPAKVPTQKEIQQNPRARSAHMRGVVKSC